MILPFCARKRLHALAIKIKTRKALEAEPRNTKAKESVDKAAL